KLVDVDIERRPVTRGSFIGDDASYTLFECGTHVEAAECIETALDDAHGFAGQDIAEARVAIQEVGTHLFAEHREHTHGAPRHRAQRAGEDPIRHDPQ